MNSQNNSLLQSYHFAGTATLTLRLVVGWTYFSAFWRRVILENKLDPDTAGYIGQKFNHFLPNALGIKPLIEYLVTHTDALHTAMVGFTVIEAIVGLFIILGLFTRLMSLGVILLALGILLGSGWLGTTCLDEWQIGVLGIAGGFVMLLTGSGKLSADYWLRHKARFASAKWFRILSSGNLPISKTCFQRISTTGAILIFMLTLFTNQYFHGGLWGKLHNKSVKPKIEIIDPIIKNDNLIFSVYRVEGADVYGSFLIGVNLANSKGESVYNLDSEALSELGQESIDNKYVVKVKPGKHSLVIPLGAKAIITLKDDVLSKLPSEIYELTLTDISGIEWKQKVIK